MPSSRCSRPALASCSSLVGVQEVPNSIRYGACAVGGAHSRRAAGAWACSRILGPLFGG